MIQVKEVNPRNGKVRDLTDGSKPVRALSPGIDGSIYIAYQNNKVSPNCWLYLYFIDKSYLGIVA